MTTEHDFRPADDLQLKEQHDSSLSQNASDREPPKRKAPMDGDEFSPKRMKHDDHFREATSERPRRGSSQERRGSYGASTAVDAGRRQLATQEEKKRGKRLFGGLLSTLSQTSGGSTQKKRMEIERRQQERIRKQSVEDSKVREEKRAKAMQARKGDQNVFDEEVMRNKHKKMLAVAQYLRTTSEPQIYYLPWRLTEEQEETIDEQLRHTKTAIAREVEAFNARKERQTNQTRRPSVREEATVPSNEEQAPASGTANDSEQLEKAEFKGGEGGQHQHDHDEAADVLEEADEDMVIY